MEASNRKIQQIIYPFFVILYFSSLPVHAQYGGGTGEPNDPYLVYTPEHMNSIVTKPNDCYKHFKLMSDVDLNIFTGTKFNIIGDPNIPFTDVFYGNGHTISNFNYTSTQKGHTWLFGFIDDPNAQNRDLGLINPEIDAGTGDYVGGMAGSSGSVTRCFWDIQTSGRNLDIKILLSKRRYPFGIVNSRYYYQAITATTLKWCFSRRIFR